MCNTEERKKNADNDTVKKEIKILNAPSNNDSITNTLRG